MSEDSNQKKSKGQKKKEKSKKKKEEPEDQPQSKFFVQEEEEDDLQPQPAIKSKFVMDNDSEEEEDQNEGKQDEELKSDAPKSKFFAPPEDDEEEEPVQKESEPKAEAPQSKFFAPPEEEEEEKKDSPTKKKGNKKKGKEDPKPEKIIEEKPQPAKIIDEKPQPASKFFVQEEEEEAPPANNQEDQPEKNEEEKTDVKKDKKKAKKAAKKDEKKSGAPVPAAPEKKDDKKGKKLGGAAKLAQERMARLKEEEDRLKQEEDERLRIEEEIRMKEEEEEKIKKEIEAKRREEKEAKIKKLKDEGKYMSKKDRIKYEQDKIKREHLEKLGLIPSEIIKTDEAQSVVTEEAAPPVKPSEQKKKFKKKNELQELEEKLKQKEMLGLPLNSVETVKPANEEILDDWTKLDESSQNQNNNPEETKEDQKIEEGEAKEEDKKNKKEKKAGKPEKQEKRKKSEKIEDKQPTSENIDSPSYQPELRSPICCILGHVDTGKTTILDKIRNTNVQEGEAGGITQQIGATFFPANKLELEISKLKSFYSIDCQVPGLLIIDTPGHESFSNLRSRGSSLCDIAILVIDLMHGLEKQTLESMELLKMRKTPFIIALNKIDRNYEWKTMKNDSSYLSLNKQMKNTQNEFYKRLDGVKLELAEKGFNSALYWENPDVSSYVSLVPTSGVTGEGLPDLLGVILKYSSKFLKQKIKMRGDVFDCTILEVKMIEGLGTTIDVILVNGTLKEGDKIILMGFNGPIITHIRALLTPHPMKEMRVKGEYIHHKVNLINYILYNNFFFCR